MNERETVHAVAADLQASQNPGRVMVIDDNADCYEFAKREAERVGVQHVWCVSGEDALAFLDTDQDFDGFIIDEKLPLKQGHEIFPDIKLRCPKAVTALSSYFTNRDIVTGLLRQGLSMMLAKPLERNNVEEFFRLVKQCRRSRV